MDCKVELIDYTGACAADPADYAARLLVYTKNTRLEQGKETRAKIAAMSADEIAKELDYISKTIRSSWEFISYTFEVTIVTRAFTHQFVRTRTGSYAQQAQRVVDFSSGFTWRMPQSVIDAGLEGQWETLKGLISSMYKEAREKGVPAQDARGILPTNAHTNILANFNLRTMADLVGKRENIRAQDEYADEVMPQLKAEVLRVHPWTKTFLNPERTKTPAMDQILRTMLGPNSPIDKPLVNEAAKELDALKGVWG